MYIARLNKSDLLDWLGGQSRPVTTRVSIDQLQQPLNDAIGLLWQEKPGSVKTTPVIFVADAQIVDFYAFVGTYVATYRPFSAYFRVISQESLPEVLQLADTQRQRSELPASLIGVAIAEAFIQSRGRVKTAADLSVSAVSSTLSAALAAAVSHGYGPATLEDIASRWQRARRLSSDDTLALEPRKITGVWGIILNAFSKKSPYHSDEGATAQSISVALRSALEGASDISEWVYPLTARIPSLGDAALRMRGAREERVRVLTDVFQVLSKWDGEPLLKEFLGGTLLSMVGNGSFDYLPLLSSLARELPGAALWFAVASALQKGNDALTAGDCLGRRTVRDVLLPLDVFAPPRDDIALEELELFGRSNPERLGFRTAQQSIIAVELTSGVSGRVRSWVAGRADTQVPTLDRQINSKDLEELSMLLDRARSAVNRLGSRDQNDLFDSRTRPSRRR